MNRNKIVTETEFRDIRKRLKEENKVVVMCHGVYDLLHYGHIEHLREAKEFGDVLVVSVTGEGYVNKGPDRPYFDDKQRTGFLSSIEFVDYVILSNEPTAITNINIVKPDIFVKGQEFQDGTDGITGNVAREIDEVKKLGGEVRFTQGAIFSSSKLLNNYFGALPDDALNFSKELLAKYGNDLFSKIEKMVEGFRNLKVLVIGDIIIDEYVFCNPQGLTIKDAVLSTRFNREERYLGGALATARHISGFVDNVGFISMMGNGDIYYDWIYDTMPKNIELDILKDENFITTVKRRYLKFNSRRNDNDKLFSINYINEHDNITKIQYEKIHEKLNDIIRDFDVVVVCDYGHGLIDLPAIDILQKDSRFLAVNCQSNSANFGMNIITKYTDVNTFAMDERELQLALRSDDNNKEEQLEQIRSSLNADIGWLTLGSAGAMVKKDGENAAIAPALTLKVTDTVGAGDAFYAVSSLCAATEVPSDIATLLSNAAGAIKTRVVGNKESINKRDLLKFVRTILNV